MKQMNALSRRHSEKELGVFMSVVRTNASSQTQRFVRKEENVEGNQLDKCTDHTVAKSSNTPNDKLTKQQNEKTESLEKWWDEEGGTLEVQKAKKDSSKIFSPLAQKYIEVPYDSWTGSPLKDHNNILRYM